MIKGHASLAAFVCPEAGKGARIYKNEQYTDIKTNFLETMLYIPKRQAAKP
jgi:hypothetical protein